MGWQKGQSGNPAGRPRSGQAVAEYIRKLAGDDAREYVDELHALATRPHNNVKARLAAIGLLLERGYGKPPQELELTGAITQLSESDVSRLSNEDIAALLSILARMSGADVPRETAALPAAPELEAPAAEGGASEQSSEQ